MSQTETTHSPTPDHLQKMHRKRIALFGLVILIAGIAIGAASAIILMPRPKPFPGQDPPSAGLMMARRLEHVLDLAPEQKEKIRLISEAAFQTLREIQEKAKPEIDAVIKDMNNKISAALTDKQRQKWQRELEDFQRRFREGWRRGGRRSGEAGPGPGYRRGPGDPNRFRGGPGWRPDDPNRPPRDFGRGSNRPRDGSRGNRGSFGRRPRPDDPNRSPLDLNSAPAAEPNRIEE